MDFQEINCDVDWIAAAQDRTSGGADVNAAMNVRIS